MRLELHTPVVLVHKLFIPWRSSRIDEKKCIDVWPENFFFYSHVGYHVRAGTSNIFTGGV